MGVASLQLQHNWQPPTAQDWSLSHQGRMEAFLENVADGQFKPEGELETERKRGPGAGPRFHAGLPARLGQEPVILPPRPVL